MSLTIARPKEASPPPYVEEIISSQSGNKKYQKEVLDLQSDDSLHLQDHYGSESSLFISATQTLHIKALSLLMAPTITLMAEQIEIGTGSSLEEVTLEARDTLILMADHIVLGHVNLKSPSILLACRRLTVIEFPEDNWSQAQREKLHESITNAHPFCRVDIIDARQSSSYLI